MTLEHDVHSPAAVRLGPADVPEVLTFLDADPVVNVYLQALVLRDALARPRDEYWAVRRDDRLTALLYLGAHSGAVLPVGEDLDAIRALGEQARGRLAGLPARFQVVGAGAAMDALLEHFPGPPYTARLARRQLYLAVAPEQLVPPAPCPELRLARVEDYNMIHETGAALRAEELLEDPREVDPVAYARRAEEDCRDGHTWVLRDARGLVFRASVSALTAEAAQVSGVYVPPAHRSQGIARRGLAELCVRLFARSRHVCLFVNDFNAPALALYRGLGFTERSAWTSAFYELPR